MVCIIIQYHRSSLTVQLCMAALFALLVPLLRPLSHVSHRGGGAVLHLIRSPFFLFPYPSVCVLIFLPLSTTLSLSLCGSVTISHLLPARRALS